MGCELTDGFEAQAGVRCEERLESGRGQERYCAPPVTRMTFPARSGMSVAGLKVLRAPNNPNMMTVGVYVDLKRVDASAVGHGLTAPFCATYILLL